ncbi:hypothetical protein C3B61_09975 [Cryobacterium zongtaii]|uniref:Lactococcin 972 family bacteriocin n=1 Tax=Cryobacterium zongtaii TaxID=1259217 RepID=A0A2S3ZFJ6_9MICO|nr:hypothetical protein C3B61_09975 [Cryobacterium zongtaii]
MALTACLTSGGAVAANASILYGDGGTLGFGTDYPSRGTWSDYHHPRRAHCSHVHNASYSVRSSNAGAGLWSRASIGTTIFGDRSTCNFV